MTETQTRAPALSTNQDLTRHVLALVLFVVLVWHTVVSPSYTAAPLRAADDDAPDAEEREVETQAAGLFAAPRVARAFTPRADEFGASDGEDELDWPEIIGDD
jgi:hypothetical protein